MYYGADYYPEHWPEERWPEDARLMREAGFNVARMAEFAWTKMEPREAEFDFGWLDRAIALLGEQGISTVLGTPTASPPAWVMRAYPECFLVREDGQRLTYGHRRNTCPTSPIYRQYSARIVTVMAEHYADNAHVIGWQIDNEFGDRCYCEACQRAFQEWLKSKYGSLEALNAAWGTVFWSHIYTAWQEIPLPWATSYTHNPSLALDYRRFVSDTYVDYQKLQVDILRRLNPDRFITHNLMGFRYPKLNYFHLAEDLDVVSWDNYPRYRGQPDLASRALSHDTMRGLKGSNFWVMEEQSGPTGNVEVHSAPRPGEIAYWAWQAVAHGADGIVYFRWRTCRFGSEEYWHGILDHDGAPRRRYREVAQLGAALQRMGTQIDSSHSQATAALLLSYDSRFALQNQPQNPGFNYEAIFASYYRALWNRHIPMDIIPPDADLSRYMLVIAPALYILDDATAARLRDYAAGGGTLVTTCRSGVMDAHNVVVNQALPGLLASLCGIEVEEYDSRDPGDTLSLVAADLLGGGSFVACTWADVLEPNGAEVLARYGAHSGADYYAGRAAVTAHAFGRGQAIYVGTVPDDAFLDQLTGWLCKGRGIAAPLDVPQGIEVTVRDSGDARFLFLLNGTAEEQRVNVGSGGRDLAGGEAISGEMALDPLQVLILEQEREK
jgi:beta-galactosidase